MNHLENVAEKAEVLALLVREKANTIDAGPLLSSFKKSIDSSASATIFPYVYRAEKSVEPLSRTLQESDAFKSAISLSLTKFVDLMQDKVQKSNLLSNGKVDSFVVTIGDSTIANGDLVAALKNINGLFFAVYLSLHISFLLCALDKLIHSHLHLLSPSLVV